MQDDKATIISKFDNLSEEEFEYVKSDFDDMDKDGSGTLTFDEVSEYLANDGGVSVEEAQTLMKQYDLDGDGVVTFMEYLQCLGYRLKVVSEI